MRRRPRRNTATLAADYPPPLSPRRGALLAQAQRRPAVRESAEHLFKRMKAKMVHLYPSTLDAWVSSRMAPPPNSRPFAGGHDVATTNDVTPVDWRGGSSSSSSSTSGVLGARDVLVLGVGDQTRQWSHHDEDWLHIVVARHLVEGGQVQCISTPAACGWSLDRIAQEVRSLCGLPLAQDQNKNEVDKKEEKEECGAKNISAGRAVRQVELGEMELAMRCGDWERDLRLHFLEDWGQWEDLLRKLPAAPDAEEEDAKHHKAMGSARMVLPSYSAPETHVRMEDSARVSPDNKCSSSLVVPLVVVHIHTAYLQQWERFTGRQVPLLSSLLELQNIMKCALIVVEQPQGYPSYHGHRSPHLLRLPPAQRRPPQPWVAQHPSPASSATRTPHANAPLFHTRNGAEPAGTPPEREGSRSTTRTEDKRDGLGELPAGPVPEDDVPVGSKRVRLWQKAETERSVGRQGFPLDPRTVENVVDIGPSSLNVVETVVGASDILCRLLSLAREAQQPEALMQRHPHNPQYAHGARNHSYSSSRRSWCAAAASNHRRDGTHARPSNGPLNKTMMDLEGLTVWYIQLTTTLLPPERRASTFPSSPLSFAASSLANAPLSRRDECIVYEQEVSTNATMFQLVLRRKAHRNTLVNQSAEEDHHNGSPRVREESVAKDDGSDDDVDDADDGGDRSGGSVTRSSRRTSRTINGTWPSASRTNTSFPPQFALDFDIYCTAHYTCDRIF